MRLLSILLLTIAATAAAALADEKTRPAPPPRAFAIETYVARTYNYLDNMVDGDGRPYFDVFWSDPAAAAHDWPDVGDVGARQWQAAIMARHMTGQTARNEKLWAKWLPSCLDAKTGLVTRPKTSYSELEIDPDEQAMTLYALLTAFADHKDPALRAMISKMVEHMPEKPNRKGMIRGFALKSLMTCVRLTGSKPALAQAEDLVKLVFDENPLFTPDNKFRLRGHVHGNLRTLLGAADYALYVKDPVLFSRVDALYRYVRSQGTRFGFLPEVVGRKGDVISCETCALMDFIGLAVTLANNGHPEYWGDVERMVRNQLAESQVADAAWLKPGTRLDTDQFTWRDVGGRMVGGYAGWSSPTQILAAKEHLPWGGPELRRDARAFQNCCGGSGTHAFFIAWKNAARFDRGTLSVHLHFDKFLPEAEIRCFQPYKGLLTIELRRPCKVRVRIPDFVGAEEIKAASSAGPVQAKVSGNYLELGEHKAGEKLEVTYPLPLTEEDATIGNPGFRQYRYRVTWKGDTVVRMTPVGESTRAKTGFSDFDHRQVEVFYGNEGPGRLYQRDYMLEPADPQPAPLQVDDGSLDFWWLR